MAGQGDLILDEIVVDGFRHEYTPANISVIDPDSIRTSISRNVSNEPIISTLKPPTNMVAEFQRERISRPQLVRVSWTGESYLDVCLHDHLKILYEIQKMFFFQCDDEMSRYCADLLPYKGSTKVWYTPTFPIKPLGWTPVNSLDWTDCLIVNNVYVNSGFTINENLGMVTFDDDLQADVRVSLGYTWKFFCNIISASFTPMDFYEEDTGRRLYQGEVVLAQRNVPSGFDEPWVGDYYCVNCSQLKDNVKNDDIVVSPGECPCVTSISTYSVSPKVESTPVDDCTSYIVSGNLSDIDSLPSDKLIKSITLKGTYNRKDNCQTPDLDITYEFDYSTPSKTGVTNLSNSTVTDNAVDGNSFSKKFDFSNSTFGSADQLGTLQKDHFRSDALAKITVVDNNTGCRIVPVNGSSTKISIDNAGSGSWEGSFGDSDYGLKGSGDFYSPESESTGSFSYGFVGGHYVNRTGPNVIAESPFLVDASARSAGVLKRTLEYVGPAAEMPITIKYRVSGYAKVEAGSREGSTDKGSWNLETNAQGAVTESYLATDGTEERNGLIQRWSYTKEVAIDPNDPTWEEEIEFSLEAQSGFVGKYAGVEINMSITILEYGTCDNETPTFDVEFELENLCPVTLYPKALYVDNVEQASFSPEENIWEVQATNDMVLCFPLDGSGAELDNLISHQIVGYVIEFEYTNMVDVWNQSVQTTIAYGTDRSDSASLSNDVMYTFSDSVNIDGRVRSFVRDFKTMQIANGPRYFTGADLRGLGLYNTMLFVDLIVNGPMRLFNIYNPRVTFYLRSCT